MAMILDLENFHISFCFGGLEYWYMFRRILILTIISKASNIDVRFEGFHIVSEGSNIYLCFGGV